MVINQSATGLFSINDMGRVININPAAVKLTKLNEQHHVNILKNIDITTLSQVISKYFMVDGNMINAEDVDSKTIVNTVKGLKVIGEQSVGLMSFVNNYRKFTKLPKPEFTEVNLSTLIESNLLAANTFLGFDTLRIEKSIPENVLVPTDEKLLSQVIINLLKNACEAIVQENTENPKLRLRLRKAENKISIEIANNGPGIPPEIKEQIFIPFYTTKEEGSGVGLSLSKQIMLKMGGDVLLYTTQDELTICCYFEFIGL